MKPAKNGPRGVVALVDLQGQKRDRTDAVCHIMNVWSKQEVANLACAASHVRVDIRSDDMASALLGWDVARVTTLTKE